MKRSFKPLATCLLGLTLISNLTIQSAQALVKVESTESVTKAVKYGIKKKGVGLAILLGPNWVEGQDGTLLNIYTPFMLLATQATKKGIDGTSDKEIKEAKKRMARVISQTLDPHYPQEIKFSIAIYGDKPNFGTQYTASIEGEGRGRSVVLKPSKVIPDKIANQNTDASVFEAINAYYFRFSEIENLETLRFIIRSPQDEKVFTVNVDDIY